MELKKELIRAIDETITTRRIVKEMHPEVGFYCLCKVKGTHIATIWEEENWTLLCSNKQSFIQHIPENNSHPCWSWFESAHCK